MLAREIERNMESERERDIDSGKGEEGVRVCVCSCVCFVLCVRLCECVWRVHACVYLCIGLVNLGKG